MLQLITYSPDAIMNGSAALLGALVGALASYIFQMLFHQKQENENERIAAHRILFCLLQQTNTLLLIQRDYIYPNIDKPGRMITIPAIPDFDITKNLFDFSSFGFFLKSKSGRKIMYDLYLAQESYIETLRAVNIRSQVHRFELQPKLASLGYPSSFEASLAKLESDLGTIIWGTMVNQTEQMICVLAESFLKLERSKIAFRSFAVDYFETDDFTNFDFPDRWGIRKDD